MTCTNLQRHARNMLSLRVTPVNIQRPAALPEAAAVLATHALCQCTKGVILCNLTGVLHEVQHSMV